MTSFPIVLMGSGYWGGLLDWIRSTVHAEGKVSADDLGLLHLTDDFDEAVQVLVEARAHRVSEAPGSGEHPVAPHDPE